MLEKPPLLRRSRFSMPEAEKQAGDYEMTCGRGMSWRTIGTSTRRTRYVNSCLSESEGRGEISTRSGLGLRRHLFELLRLATRNSQRLPLARPEVLCQKHNLPDMCRIVRNLSIDGLQDGVRFSADGYGSAHIFRFERFDCCQNATPAVFPPPHHLGTGGGSADFELSIAKTVWLLAVAHQEVGEARAHIARQMLDQNRN